MSVSATAFVHESAYVDDGATVGDGTKIWHFCHVMPGAVIGARCSLGQNVVVMNGTRIGDNCKIQNNVSVYEGVELEDDVFCGPSMVFTNVLNPRSHVSRKHEYRATRVRRAPSRFRRGSLPGLRYGVRALWHRNPTSSLQPMTMPRTRAGSDFKIA